MALIKQANADHLVRDAVVLDLGDLCRQGELIVEQARKRAEAIIREAEAERTQLVTGGAEVGRAEGYARGLEEGRAAGAVQGRNESLQERSAALAALEAAWTGALDSFNAARDSMLRGAAIDLVRLAAQIASKVTRRTVDLDPRAVEPQLEAVLGHVMRPTKLVIAVHPKDLTVAREVLPDLVSRCDPGMHAELVEDGTLQRGSCVVRARDAVGGEIDASIDTQLERIATALLPGSPGECDAPGEVRP